MKNSKKEPPQSDESKEFSEPAAGFSGFLRKGFQKDPDLKNLPKKPEVARAYALAELKPSFLGVPVEYEEFN